MVTRPCGLKGNVHEGVEALVNDAVIRMTRIEYTACILVSGARIVPKRERLMVPYCMDSAGGTRCVPRPIITSSAHPHTRSVCGVASQARHKRHTRCVPHSDHFVHLHTCILVVGHPFWWSKRAVMRMILRVLPAHLSRDLVMPNHKRTGLACPAEVVGVVSCVVTRSRPGLLAGDCKGSDIERPPPSHH